MKETQMTRGRISAVLVAALLAAGCLEKPAPWVPGEVGADGMVGDLRSGDSSGDASVRPVDWKAGDAKDTNQKDVADITPS
jgi:hypothetical protein